MAAGGLVLLLLLAPLALAEPPCGGYEVLEGFGLQDVEMPSQVGVKLLETPVEEELTEEACWGRCCAAEGCDLAQLSAGRCYLVRCVLQGLDLCELSPQEGARSYRRVERGRQPAQDDFCLPNKETGRCRAAFERWFYDAETESCMNFTYGGCGGNLNNHAGEEECMQKCQGVKAVKSGDTETPSKRTVPATPESKPEPAKVQAPKRVFEEYCAAPAVTGYCRAAFPRWFYEPSSSTCKQFVYGGCKGNKNNYVTETDCMSMCSGGHAEDDDIADHSMMHRSVTAVVLPILLALLAATLLAIMILFFVKVARKNQETAGFRAMWNPIDDKECLMNSAYTL